jgi:hypothetical protein
LRALILLSSAGLLIRSFLMLQRVDPGFRHTNVLTFRISLEGPRYATAAQRIAFTRSVLEQLEALPGANRAHDVGFTFERKSGYGSRILFASARSHPDVLGFRDVTENPSRMAACAAGQPRPARLRA